MSVQAGVAVTRSSRKAQPLTWLGRPWRDRAWLHPLYGTASVYVAGSVVETVVSAHPDWSTWAVGAATGLVGAATAVGGVLAAAGDRFTGWARGYLGAAGLAAGTWLTYAAVTSPYRPGVALAALAAAAVFTGAYPAMRHTQLSWEERYRARRLPPAQAAAGPLVADRHRSPEAVRVEALFARAGFPGLTFRERTPTRAGFSLLMRVPDDGKITLGTLSRNTERIEIAFGLAEGCVTVERATDENGRSLAREVWVHFDVEDILTQTLTMPAEHTPLSINEAFPIGKYADGEIIYLKLREIAALIVGVRGRGKTNLLNAIIHQLSRCTDVVLWMIDLKGGRAAKPWLQPWLDGRVDRPVLDWVATDRFEAHRMLVGAHALIAQRGQTGAGGSKIKPSRALPAVIVICDEIAAVVGARSGPKSARDGQGETSRTLANILATCIQLGRSEAVDFVLATQRSTVTMIGNGDLKSQCELRIGLGVTNPQDARAIFEGNAVAARMLNKLKDKATRGAVLIQDGDGGRIAPGKAFFMGDDDEQATVTRAAELHASYPAPLDELGQAAVDAALRLMDADAGYFDRWSEDRAGHLYGDDNPDTRHADPTRAPRPSAPVSAVPDTEPAGRQSRFFPARGKPSPPARDEFAEEWARIVDGYESSTATEPAYPSDAENASRYERMIELIDGAGPVGITPGQILANMRQAGIAWDARTSVYPALKKALADGRIVQPAGRKGRYYTPRNTR